MLKTTSKLFILFLFLAVGVYTAQAQITAQEAVKAMGRGINMGNTLDAPNYEGEWGTEARKYYFDMYADAGFKTVRIPITWNKRFGTTAPYTVDTNFFKRLDTIISWSLNHDLYTIINIHHDGWVKDANTFESNKERLFALWDQIIEHYKDYPEKLFFEILNEPHSDASLTKEQVDEVNSTVLSAIREVNPTRIVVYSGTGWGSSSDMMGVSIPATDDDYLMATYHSYDPWNFAGQSQGTWGTASDKQSMIDQMARVKEWSQENNMPVLIGEFGAMHDCHFNSRMLYYATYAEQALAHDLAFTVWDDDGWFQILEREDTAWNEVKDVVIYSSDSSITNLQTKQVEDTAIELSWTSRADTNLVEKVLIQKRLLNTEFVVVGELGAMSGTTFIDRNAVEGVYSYYRVVDVYADKSIPSYQINALRLPTDREPFDGVISIPGVIEAENFDKGGEMLTYHDTDAENQGGAYRLDEAVDVEARTDGFQVGYVAEGEWLEYTINVATAGTYEITAHLASMDGGGSMKLKFGSVTAPIITAPKTSSWTSLETVTVKKDLKAGEQVLRLSIESTPAFNIDKIEVSEYTSVDEFENASLQVYPNPTNDQLFIELAGSKIETIGLYNNKGQLVMNKTVDAEKVAVDVTDFTIGIYFVIANTSKGLVKTTFVKQ